MNQTVEIRASYRYVKEHSWVVQGITGFLSAYFMEKPGFNLQRHFEELETGMHVWVCDIPPKMKVLTLLRRLTDDIPPCHYQQLESHPPARPQFLIDSQEEESALSQACPDGKIEWPEEEKLSTRKDLESGTTWH